ncbi:hypothetical protein DdX_01598 [Ditylenchus destructor]|uniref:Uncharacterized protein n=1 Tax=Ditylenchus destructor TaxID=166010 RepID=A0AAD4NJI0_9BILA|nr:hypothetical protein DdX_01598 [Ditylenchus destructor]
METQQYFQWSDHKLSRNCRSTSSLLVFDRAKAIENNICGKPLKMTLPSGRQFGLQLRITLPKKERVQGSSDSCPVPVQCRALSSPPCLYLISQLAKCSADRAVLGEAPF